MIWIETLKAAKLALTDIKKRYNGDSFSEELLGQLEYDAYADLDRLLH